MGVLATVRLSNHILYTCIGNGEEMKEPKDYVDLQDKMKKKNAQDVKDYNDRLDKRIEEARARKFNNSDLDNDTSKQ